MKILLLTQWFDPEPTFKGMLFARELTARGHQVEVLTGFPNYPGGEVYPGYRIRPWVRERIDGISVVRVALYPSHDKSSVGRVLNYATFAISAATTGAALIKRPDAIYVYHPPATIGFAAIVIGFLRRAPFVLDVQDLWPDTVAVSGMLSNRMALSLLGWYCSFVYRCARHIVVLSPGFKDQLVQRGVPEDKIDVIYNWCDGTTFQPAAPDPELATSLGLSGRFNVMFAGTMGTAQSLDSVLEAAALSRESRPEVQFVFVGGGVDRSRLEKNASERGLTNVRFLERQPMREMGAVLALADVLLVHLKSDPLFSITIPSKTQAYMASGKPLLMAMQGDAAELVAQSGGGLVCEPENPKSIAEAVARFAAMTPVERCRMGMAGKNYYDRNLSLKAGVGRFEPILAAASRRRRVGKRLFDLAATIPVFVLISPLILVLWLCTIAFLGKPGLFRQTRPGYREKPFTIYKFRTMRNTTDSSGQLLPDSERLSRFGSFLRRTSLDELPELWNVLRGEMSLVGPRPLLPEYLPLYTVEQRRRHEVKPGITGWAQVHGRNAISWEEKFKLDIWYVDRGSLWLDFGILLMTAGKVFRADGISPAGQVTMPRFGGSGESRAEQ